MLAAVVVSFILGTLFSLVLAVSGWLYTSSRVKREKRDYIPPFIEPSLPQSIQDSCGGGGGGGGESCRWLNYVIAFLFQELRDTPVVKNWILNKVHKEFNELMFTRKEGRMLEQLTVRDYDIGSSLPLFSNAVVLQQCLKEDSTQLEELYVSVDVDYSGGFRIGIDADLILNRVAFVDIRVVKVKGCGQLQFTTIPHTHWSFSFSEEPEIVLEVESTFEGRSLPQLSSFMETQLRRWVRQKHTLPARKTRHKPFFLKPQPQSQLEEQYVHDERMTVGRLCVEVGKASQLVHSPSATATFCTVSISSLPWQPLLGIWRSRWAELEFKIQRDEEVLGFRYRLVGEWKERRNEFVMIFEVLPDSVAARTGIRIGDIIMRVNNVKVRSVAQVQKTINKIKSGCVLLTVRRPPKHISQHMLQTSSTHKTTPTMISAMSGVSSDVEEGGGGVGDGKEEGDSISLCGVGGERDLSLDGQGPDRRTRRLPRDVGRREEEEEEDKAGKQTEDVAVCRNPRWKKKKFNFDVGPQHHYLNVCVYDKVRSEDRGELLVGHVSLPLMDVALECLVSSLNRHTQRYVLLAPQLTRATSSRAAMQAASEGKRGSRKGKEKIKEMTQDEGKKFVGSVLLRFKHSSLEEIARVNAEQQEENEEQEREAEEEEEEEEEDRVLYGSQEIKHQFQLKELAGVQRCHVCRKRIWVLKGRVMVCENCHVQCHKKCSHLLKPCRPPTDLQLHEASGFQIYDEREGGEHCELQQLSDEHLITRARGEEEEEDEDEEEVSWRTAEESDMSGSSSDELTYSEGEREGEKSANEEICDDDERDLMLVLQKQ